MTLLERRGLVSLLTETRGHLARYFQEQVIANDSACPVCQRYGGGTCVPHAPDCRGVALLTDIDAAIATLQKGEVGCPR
jgi:hypothetical protein